MVKDKIKKNKKTLTFFFFWFTYVTVEALDVNK